MPRHSPYALCSLNFLVLYNFALLENRNIVLFGCLLLKRLVYHPSAKLYFFYHFCLERPNIIFIASFYLFVFYSLFKDQSQTTFRSSVWSVWMDSNHRPRAYQARALTTWATDRYRPQRFTRSYPSLVEMMGFEPMTPCLQGRCSPNWATPPCSYSNGPSKLNNRSEQLSYSLAIRIGFFYPKTL